MEEEIRRLRTRIRVLEADRLQLLRENNRLREELGMAHDTIKSLSRSVASTHPFFASITPPQNKE